MRAIWKYPIEVSDQISIQMPKGAEMLTVQTQNGQPQLWALVDPASHPRVYLFAVYGTGHPIEGNAGDYIGTFQLLGGSLVFHLFQLN